MEASELLKAKQKSCGCRKLELIGLANTKHGKSKHPAYAVWSSMKARCLRTTHHAYARYGGRGITVCPEWVDSFENFWADMAATYREGLTLERVNNALGYYPANCAWVNRKAQARNTRKNISITTPMGEMPLWRAEEVSGIGKSTLLYRKSADWKPERMFDKPDFTNRCSTS